MERHSLEALERRCQKPDHRRIGNWMARRISRPAALRVTAVLAPWGVSANAVTLLAWGVAAAAAAALGWGTPLGWLLGALLLELWYLLDHVDGQLARLRAAASLDGAQLDYLMHHTVDLLVPAGAGLGLFAATAEPWWLVAGLVWGVALQLIMLQHDARYRSFLARLQQLRGRLEVHGRACGGPQPQPPVPRRPLRLAAWIARKLCETHVLMNLLLAAAVVQWLLGDDGLWTGRALVAILAPTAVAVALWTLVRSQRGGSCEREFAAWFRVPAGHELVYRDGRWNVEEGENSEDASCKIGRQYEGPAMTRKE